MEGGGGDTAVAVAARPALSLEQRLSNRKRLLAAQQRPAGLKGKIQAIQPAGDCDIVGSILSSQSKWLSAKKADVVINRDGSLDFKSKEPPKNEAPPTQRPDPLERLAETRVDVKEATADKHIAKAPLYPNSGGGGRGPRAGGPRAGGPGVNNFSFRGRQSGGGPVGTFTGPSGSNFRAVYSGGSPGFGPQNTRAQYEHFLGNNAQNNPQPRSAPLRFRLNNPRIQLRRNAGLMNRRQGEQPQDERNNGRRADDGVRGDGTKDEEDDVDIYSDIEADSAGRENSEQEEGGEREYGTLMPPPEPPALLMAGFGDVGSDDDVSDSELVIDDRWASSPKGSKPGEREGDKYDPAEPSHDSDNEDDGRILADEIPLPPDDPPEEKRPADATTDDVSQPAQEKTPEDDPEKAAAPKADAGDGDSSDKEDEEASKKSEEASPVTPEGPATPSTPATPATPALDDSAESDKPPSPRKDEAAKVEAEPSAESKENGDKAEKSADETSESDDDDCPNFSIYSAATMELARRAGEEDGAAEVAKETVDTGKSAKEADDAEKDEAAPSVEGEEGLDSPAPDSRTKVHGDVESDPEAEARKEGLLEVNVEKDEVRELSESAREDESDDEREERKKRRRSSSNSDEDGPADSTEKIPLKKRHDDDDDKGKDADEIFGSDDDSLVGGATSAVSTGTLENVPVASVVPGLEGLETETISETEEAINFDDISDEEVARKRKKKSRRRSSGEDGGKRDSPPTSRPSESAEFEEGEILDESLREQNRKERKDKEAVAEENVDTSKAKSSPPAEDDKRRKKKKAPSKERAVVTSSESKSKGKDKSSKDISWKKPSKSTRDRNYRDGKEKRYDREERENSRSRKKKEKRKDLERYDVRKVLSDRTLSKQNKDAFGRDIDRRRTLTRSRSRSRARSPRKSRSRSRSRARSLSRTRARGRRQSRGRSRTRSRHRSALRSKDRPRRSRSKDKKKKKTPSRERERTKRSRSKNRSGSRSRNRTRGTPPRSRSRSPLRNKERRKEVRDPPARVRTTWSRSPSRSWSPSLTGSPQYPVSAAVGRRHDRTMLRSLSRSWSREPVDRLSSVAATKKRRKNLTVIVTNSKEETRKRRKEQARRNLRRRLSPPPSKEVFASGDNILVSVNFKSNKNAAGAPAAAAPPKKRREEVRARRTRKDRATNKDAQPDKASADKRKKVPPEANQKPVAIIDLEQSPFREYTPSPKDVIVLSDSEEDLNQKTVEELEQMHHHITDEGGLNISGLTSSMDEGQLQSSGHSGVSSYLMTSTGPKTPPEPQIKFSISKQQQLRTISNPLMDQDDDDEEEEIEDGATQNDVDMMTHKGPNTPPESPLGPATPASPTTSPDAYDPFDPTKSRSPSPDQGAAGAKSSGTPRVEGDAGNGPATVDEAVPKSAADASNDTKTSPQKASEADATSKKSPPKASPGVLPEVSRMLDSLDDAEKKSPVLSADATSTTVAGKAAVSSAGSTEVTSTSSNRANTFNIVASTNMSATQRLLGSAIKVRPATKANLPLPKVVPLRQNGEPVQPVDIVDMDLDSSPYSPASSEGDDLFDPPPNYSSRAKTSAAPTRAQKTSAATKDKFDNLFGSSPAVGNKYSPWSKNAPKVSSKNAAKMNKLVSKHIAKLSKCSSALKYFAS